MTSVKKELAHPNSLVRVSAPARLHLGFLDLNGQTGRKFGSIGLAIDTHHTIIEARLATPTAIHCNADTSQQIIQKSQEIIDNFYNTLGRHIPNGQRDVQLSLIDLIPQHAGLGSGTQLTLTIGTALCRLHDIAASTSDIAFKLGRGSRSGIGIATFDYGGFIIDGGLSNTSPTPPLLMHYDFPKDWRVVTIMDHRHQGVHGTQEVTAFNELPEFPVNSSQEICHLTLMKLLPALVEQNIEQFGQAITDIQSLIGDHFAPIQGGRYTSQHIASLLNYAKTIGHTGIAQSSWGPTSCVFVDSEQSAKLLINKLNQYSNQQFNDTSRLEFTTAKASPTGANIEIITL